jgi:hypothetical protein
MQVRGEQRHRIRLAVPGSAAGREEIVDIRSAAS